MTDDQTFEDLAHLLGLYPGVSLSTAGRMGDNEVWIKFRCGSIESLKNIADCAAASNLVLEVGTSSARFSDETAEPSDLSFTISIDEDWLEDAPPSSSQVFGIFLARDLKAHGHLAQQKSDEIQTRWNALPE